MIVHPYSFIIFQNEQFKCIKYQLDYKNWITIYVRTTYVRKTDYLSYGQILWCWFFLKMCLYFDLTYSIA